MRLRRVQAGVYETPEGRYRVQREDYEGGDFSDLKFPDSPEWVIWDTETDDYAFSLGARPFLTKREATGWLERRLAERLAEIEALQAAYEAQ